MEIEKLVFHNCLLYCGQNISCSKIIVRNGVSLLMLLDNTVKIICLIPIKISWLLVLKAMQMCKHTKSTICVCKLWLLGQSSKVKTLTVLITFVILRRPDGRCAAAARPAASEAQASPSSAAAEGDPAAGRTGPGRRAAKGTCCCSPSGLCDASVVEKLPFWMTRTVLQSAGVSRGGS